MSQLRRGHIIYRGRTYVNATVAGRIMKVSRTTIRRWYEQGYLEGVQRPSGPRRRRKLFVLKEGLSRGLLVFSCSQCGKTVRSTRLRDPSKNNFCSKKCSDKWWNTHRPVDSDGKRMSRRNSRS